MPSLPALQDLVSQPVMVAIVVTFCSVSLMVVGAYTCEMETARAMRETEERNKLEEAQEEETPVLASEESTTTANMDVRSRRTRLCPIEFDIPRRRSKSAPFPLATTNSASASASAPAFAPTTRTEAATATAASLRLIRLRRSRSLDSLNLSPSSSRRRSSNTTSTNDRRGSLDHNYHPMFAGIGDAPGGRERAVAAASTRNERRRLHEPLFDFLLHTAGNAVLPHNYDHNHDHTVGAIHRAHPVQQQLAVFERAMAARRAAVAAVAAAVAAPQYQPPRAPQPDLVEYAEFNFGIDIGDRPLPAGGAVVVVGGPGAAVNFADQNHPPQHVLAHQQLQQQQQQHRRLGVPGSRRLAAALRAARYRLQRYAGNNPGEPFHEHRHGPPPPPPPPPHHNNHNHNLRFGPGHPMLGFRPLAAAARPDPANRMGIPPHNDDEDLAVVARMAELASEREQAMEATLKPVRYNYPNCKSCVAQVKTTAEATLLAIALESNTTLEQIHLFPADWKDWAVIQRIAKAVAKHPCLQQVHLFQRLPRLAPLRNRDAPDGPQPFMADVALNLLLRAMASNSSIRHWKLNLTNFVSEVLCESIQMCPHLEQLELIGLSSTTCMKNAPAGSAAVDTKGVQLSLGTAIAKAQPSLQVLKLIKLQTSTVAEDIFRCCYDQQQSTADNNVLPCPLNAIHVDTLMEATCTAQLGLFLSLPTCQVQSLTLKSIQAFYQPNMVQLVKGLIQNTSMRHISFLDCSFHPEVVRSLQELVRARLDLESFQMARCNADPSMAVMTCFQTNDSNVKSLTMGYSLGIEERLGGDAIRYVLRYNQTLQRLNLTGSNRLGLPGMRSIGKGLAKNSTLQHLDLSHCTLRMPWLQLILDGIKRNPESQLVSLNLSHNELSLDGVNMLVNDWVLTPGCKVQKLILNRCALSSDAFLTLLRAATESETLEYLEVQDCGQLLLEGLQTAGELLFHISHLKVLKASCGGNFIRPRQHMNIDDPADVEFDPADQMGDPLFPGGESDNEESDDEEDETQLLKETWNAALIHNTALEHISLANMLSCCVKPRDAGRMYAWMDFCGKRNQLQARLQGTDLPLLDILTDTVNTCWDHRKLELTPTGVSLNYHCLRHRPDGVATVQHLLTQEAERQEQLAAVGVA